MDKADISGGKWQALEDIRKAKKVRVRALFALFEGWVDISKADARHLVKYSWNETCRAELDQHGDLYLDSN